MDSLPPELICRILLYLCPRDVLRVRLVSKVFNNITYDPTVWRAIYANARVPRPPGPFPSQSTCFLEQTLIRSERLAESWTTQPIQAVSCTQIRLEGLALGHPRIIGSRWLVTFESYKQIVCYDVEMRSRQVLLEETGLVASWDVCSITSTGEPLIYLIFRQNTRDIWRASWKLLEFRVHVESGRLSHSVSLDVPSGTKCSAESAYFVGDKTPFLYIAGKHLVFDTRTRTFYQFPEFSSELDEMRGYQFALRQVLLSNTHIVAIFSNPLELDVPSLVKPTLVQAFIIPGGPHLAGGSTGFLRLSHEGIMFDQGLANLIRTRNSFTDLVTGSTNLRFLQYQQNGDGLPFACVDLRLPRSYLDVILPLSIDVHDIFKVEHGIHDLAISPAGYYLEASDDGYARGFCRNLDGNGSANSSWITKFTIDATGDECVATVGQASSPRWVHNDRPPRFSALSFDGVIGRCCYLKNGDDWRLDGSVDIAVVDIR